MSMFDRIKKIFSDKKEPENHADVEVAASPSVDFYAVRLEGERLEKDHFFKHSAYSPLEDRSCFNGLNYYPPNPDYCFDLPLQKADEPELLTLQTSTGDEQSYHRLGIVEFAVEGEPAKLAVYQSTDHEGLFIPFRDATSGKETYGAGRYLEPQEMADGKIHLDFNLAYNPFCAYAENYSCPLPPFENHLKVPIRAGEKSYKNNH